MNIIQELKEKVKSIDYSVDNNSGVQRVIENELVRWVKSYELKKTSRYCDCYGSPGEIPDQIDIDGTMHSPNEILEHAKTRDKIGMNIMKKIYDARVKYSIFGNVNENVIKAVPDNADPDQLAVMCGCGKHNKTWKNMLEDVIDSDPECIFLKVEYSTAVQSLYGGIDDFTKERFKKPKDKKPLVPKLLKNLLSKFLHGGE